MKTLLFLLLLTIAISSSTGSDHPADEAFAALRAAKENYEGAEKLFIRAVALINDDSKREETRQAFEKRKKAWIELAQTDAELKIAASPAPDTSTSSSLIPYWTEVRYLRLHADQLREQAEWITANWKE